jgi:flavodoxin
MYNVLVLWAPDSGENRKTVEAVARALEQTKVTLVAKGAQDASIADVNAADIVVFGVQKPSSGEVPSEFSELTRIFKGISLAGRTAGFFSLGTERATAHLRKVLQDTEITQFEEDPLFSDQQQGPSTAVAEWSEKLIRTHQEMHNARK